MLLCFLVFYYICLIVKIGWKGISDFIFVFNLLTKMLLYTIRKILDKMVSYRH
jgi:hypothetical protein